MKRAIVAALLCAATTTKMSAQNGWLPPYTFTQPTNVCDASGYQLVFSEDFNGNTLSNKWIDYKSYDGMHQGSTPLIWADHDNWENAKGDGNDNEIFLSKNVSVGNGICTLKVMHEDASWHCATCNMPTRFRHFTSGYISTPFLSPAVTSTPTRNSYNAGRFEAKIKFPSERNTWCAFWLWNGAGVNEIDMAEAVGGTGQWPYLGSKAHPKVTYDLHAWRPNPNPLNLVGDADLSNEYPDQSWYNFFIGNNFHQEDWHIYACEWDTAVIRTYLDYSLQNTIWKYYIKGFLNFKIGSGCMASGQYNITYGFPYNNFSESQIRLSSGVMDGSVPPQSGAPSTQVGQMEIDYLRAWQRDDQACIGQIWGPDLVCNQDTFSVITGATNISWTVSPQLSIVSTFGTNIAVKNNGSTNTSPPYIQCTCKLPGCDVIQTFKRYINVGKPKVTTIVFSKIKGLGQSLYIFGVTSPSTQPYAAYNWDIYYGPNGMYHTSQTGQYAQFWAPTYSSGTFNWTLSATNKCGTTLINGATTFLYKGADVDTTAQAYYFNALVTDSLAYEQAVSDKIEQTFVTEEEALDTVALYSKINKIRLDELAPYIVHDTSGNYMSRKGFMPITISPAAAASTTKIYPNPTSSNLNLVPGIGFQISEPIIVKIYSTTGQLLINQQFPFEGGQACNIKTQNLPVGFYVVEVRQGDYCEHQKLIKH